VALWRHTWQHAYPAIVFWARLAWWQARGRDEFVVRARVRVAEIDNHLVGFVTVDGDGDLDQIVVAPEAWAPGIAAELMAQASACLRTDCTSMSTMPARSASTASRPL